MIYLISFILMVAVLAYIALPLFRGSREAMAAGDEGLTELQAQKNAAYTAIKELQFEYELGNLSPADHQELEEKYKTRAVEILKELDGVKGEPSRDDVEKEILDRRKGGQGMDDEIERQIARRRSDVAAAAQAPGNPCPRCGRPQKAQVKFCTTCGASMKMSCPACGASYSRADRFCSSCGASLTKG